MHLVVEVRDLAEIRHFCNHKLGIRWVEGEGGAGLSSVHGKADTLLPQLQQP